LPQVTIAPDRIAVLGAQDCILYTNLFLSIGLSEMPLLSPFLSGKRAGDDILCVPIL